MSGTRRIEVPFKIALPHDLPSTFMYAGGMMSVFRVQYTLDVKFLGLKGLVGQMPAANQLYQEQKCIEIRAMDPQTLVTIS